VCDAIVVFEGALATFQSSPPANYSGYGIDIGHIIYSCPQTSAVATLQNAAALGADLIYVTDESDGAYNTLPTYFQGQNQILRPAAVSATATTAAVSAVAAQASPLCRCQRVLPRLARPLHRPRQDFPCQRLPQRSRR